MTSTLDPLRTTSTRWPSCLRWTWGRTNPSGSGVTGASPRRRHVQISVRQNSGAWTKDGAWRRRKRRPAERPGITRMRSHSTTAGHSRKGTVMTESRTRRILVVVDHAEPTPALMDVLVRRGREVACSSAIVLNPARAEVHLLHPDRHVKASEAEQTLREVLPKIEEAAHATVIGSVSVRHDPMDAIEAALADEPIDEIVLAVPPHRLSTWLGQDLAHRLNTGGFPSRRCPLPPINPATEPDKVVDRTLSLTIASMTPSNPKPQSRQMLNKVPEVTVSSGSTSCCAHHRRDSPMRSPSYCSAWSEPCAPTP